MLKSTFVVLIFGVIAAMLPASAKPLPWNGPLTQAQVIARARRSFAAQLAALKAQSAAAHARSARARALPQISVSETALNSTLKQFGMPEARQVYGSLNASVPLFAPEAWAAARAAGLDATAADAVAAMKVNDAVTDAVQKYDAAALTREIAQLRARDVRDQQMHLSITKARVQTGAAPRYVLAVDQAALAQMQQSEEDARAAAVHAMHALEVLLDFDIGSTPAVALVPPASTFTPNAAALELRAYIQRPDVVGAELALLAAKQRLVRAHSEYLPTIAASVQTYNGTSNPPLGRAGSQIGVSASLPLFDGGSRAADTRTAQVNYERSRIELDRARLQAQADVLDAVRDVQAAQRNVASADSELASANEQLSIAELRERAGKGSELDTLDALATRASAREDALRATARYDDSRTALRGAVGDYAPPSY